MNTTLIGAGLGALAAAGLLTAILSSPPMRRVTLADRIAPYLGDTAQPSRLLGPPSGPASTMARLTAPLLRQGVRRLDRIVGGQSSVRRRLAALGSQQTVEQFRTDQLIWGLLGLLAGLGISTLALITGQAGIALVVLLTLGGFVTGILARDYWLSREVATHDAEILAEFPVIAEMLALAVTAGEGPIGALDRVCRLAQGRLVDQLQAILADTRSGTPLVEALTVARDRTSLEPLARFLDGMAVAADRGTPLADVLRAQAADVRALGKRELLEAGGRKEVAMMIPVVFLVLPVTILFAMYPGLIAITTVAG